jgi:hypothetical protein
MSDDEDSMDDSEYSDDERHKQDAEFVEACPTDFSEILWQKILNLREQKLDLEENVAEIQKFADVSD